MDLLVGGGKEIWKLDVGNDRRNNDRARVAKDGTLDVFNRRTQLLTIACLLATVSIALVLLFFESFGGEGKVAGAVMLSSIVFALLPALGQTGSWPRLLVDPYVPAGDGVGWLDPSPEGVVAKCFEDGVVPYKENYCWSGQDSTKGTLACQGLKSQLVDKKYGSGSVLVAPDGSILGVVSDGPHRSMAKADTFVVHSSIGDVEYGSTSDLIAITRTEDGSPSLDWHSEECFLLLTILSTAVVVGLVFGVTPAGQVEVSKAKESAVQGSTPDSKSLTVIEEGTVEAISDTNFSTSAQSATKTRHD